MRVISLFAVLVAGPAFAAAFAVDTQGSRAMGFGNAYTALSNDPSGVYYNPAGLVGPTGLDLQAGGTLQVPQLSYRSPNGDVVHDGAGPAVPPHLFVRYGLHPRVAFGLGVYSPFATDVRWPDDWAGRLFGTSTQLSAYCISPVAVLQFHEKVKGGAGIQFLRADMTMARAIAFGDTVGQARLNAGAWGLGFVAGAQLRVIKDWFEVGGSWRTGIDLQMEGTAQFEGVPAEQAQTFRDQNVHYQMRVPDVWMGGITSRPIPQLLLALDGHYTTWNGLREFRLKYEDKALNSEVTKIWRDTISVHLGGEYTVSPALQVRAGFVYDPTPVIPSTLTPDLPDATRLKLSVGAGYRLGALTVDGAYQFVAMLDQSSTSAVPGTYGGTAHQVSATLTYHLE